jgi:hypothetical protein
MINFECNLFLPTGDVVVNKLLEGSSIIESKSLKAKMINGENVQLRAVGSINVGAMYSLESALRTTKGDVHVGLMQGNTKVCLSLHRGQPLLMLTYLVHSMRLSFNQQRQPPFLFLPRQLTQVLTEVGDVSIMGVDGSFEIDVTKGNITLQVNKLNSSSSKQLSTAITLDGNVHTTVDPEVN